MIHFTRNIDGNLYYRNDVNGKWVLIVCLVVNTDTDCANDFLKDNPDCGVITIKHGLIFIAFNDDLGKDKVL